MAPHWPEEVDVFSVPHSRMKKLVHKYSNMITSTDFRDEIHLVTLLKNLMNVFTEFKAHEQIENILIMRKLKSKLKAASVTSAAVCNCHSDNRLTDMLDLVEDGYRWAHKTEHERQMYGKKLRNALEIFTDNFIPHMEEEEEVFQPMLMQYFSYEELKELKAKVIYQHDISKQHEEYHYEKFVEDLFVSDDSSELLVDSECHFSKLPTEICLQIFSLLGPRDLARVGQVSQKCLNLAKDACLWSRLHPVHWARGNWSFTPETLGGVDGRGLLTTNVDEEDEHKTYFSVDEDADIDESSDSDGTESLGAEGLKQIVKEARMLTSIVKYLLPQVGPGVRVCDLAFSKGLSSSLVHKILKLCPNLEVLDLTHTNVGDIAFKELGVSGRQSKLRHLDLTGCENITDMTLISLASMGRKSLSYGSKDERNVEIENIPRPCAQKLRVCCGRSTSCRPHVSHPHGQDYFVSTVADNDDLNFVYMNMPLEPGESLSSSGGNSITDAFSDMSLTSQLSYDNDAFLADSSPKQSNSSLCQRTCDAEESLMKVFTEKQCCDSTFEGSVPHVLNSVNRNCNISAPCSDANHIGCHNRHTATARETDDSACTLEFLSLNGCFRISDEGLSALAEGEGTSQLHHLDLSGCVAVTATGLSKLVSTSRRLDHSNLYYCENMSDDPYFTTASGCRNLQCETRFCCSIRE